MKTMLEVEIDDNDCRKYNTSWIEILREFLKKHELYALHGIKMSFRSVDDVTLEEIQRICLSTRCERCEFADLQDNCIFEETPNLWNPENVRIRYLRSICPECLTPTVDGKCPIANCAQNDRS